MLERCLKKLGAVFSTTYVKSPGTAKNSKINIETGRFINVNVKAISLTKMKIISMAKTLLASVKMASLSKIPAIWIIAFQE